MGSMNVRPPMSPDMKKIRMDNVVERAAEDTKAFLASVASKATLSVMQGNLPFSNDARRDPELHAKFLALVEGVSPVTTPEEPKPFVIEVAGEQVAITADHFWDLTLNNVAFEDDTGIQPQRSKYAPKRSPEDEQHMQQAAIEQVDERTGEQ